jgi:hypothetical protein
MTTLEQKLDRLNEGVLCSIQTGFWGASAKYDKNKLGKEVPKQIVRAMQDLLDDKMLMDDIRNIQWQAKYLVKNNSLPFPIDGVFFLPKNQIGHINKRLEELMEEFDTRVSKFIRNYDGLIKKFKKRYPVQYKMQAKKYPSKKSLRNRFYLRWTFFSIDAPDSTAGILDPNDYKRTVDKFQGMVDEMEEMALNVIANDLFTRLNKLRDQCTTGEKLHGKSVSSLNRFLDKWKDLWRGNIDNKRMKVIVSRLKKEMKKVEITRLKDNQNFREEFAGKLGSIMDKIDNIPNVTLKRKLDI